MLKAWDVRRNRLWRGRGFLPTFSYYVDNNPAPTIASNLLEANAVLSCQVSCQRAKRCGSLLCTTISHPPVCYVRQFLLSATHRVAEWQARTYARKAVNDL